MIFVLSAPSGTGKTTVLRILEKKYRLPRQVTCTTRPPRSNEIDGRDYLFVTGEKFWAMAEAGEFAEWAEVYGHRYGTPRGGLEARLAARKPVILALDTQGAVRLKTAYPGQTVLIGLLPPSLEELERRLTSRAAGTGEPAGALARRLGLARREMEIIRGYDRLVINDEPEKAARVLFSIIRREENTAGNRPGVS